MKSDIEYFRQEEDHALIINVLEGVVCECGSGEVHQPLQTMDMPMYWYCFRCGRYEPASEFRRVGSE